MRIRPILLRKPASMQGTPSLKSAFRLLILASILLLFAGCGGAPVKLTPATREAQAAQMEQEGKYADAAQIREALAASLPETARDEALVTAAEDWLQAGNWQRAATLVARIKTKGLYPALTARIEMLKAGIALANHDPKQALAHLRFPLDALPEELKARVALLRGQVHVSLGDTPTAVQDWSERETHLAGNAPEITANHLLIWRTLTETHTPIDLTKLPVTVGPVARGWIELADIARSSWQQPDKMLARLQDWQQRYPQHPALADLLPQLEAKQEALTAYPQRIAVLLPFSGNYQSQATAVRDGIMTAYYQVAANGKLPSVTFYDSGTTPAQALAAYQQAVTDGANMVIGPLIKDAVAAVAAQASLPVPVLALNYLDAGKAGPAGFYQFGLRPEGEAEQAAERAFAEGYRRGVVLVSNDDFGARMFNAFANRFKQLGGELLGMQTYAPGTETYTPLLTQLFNLDASNERAQRLADVLGTRLDFDPRRRQDLQFIFLTGTPHDARALQPQIAYNHGEGLPVYSTSRIYELGDNVDNTTLNGISFDDMPWTLEDTGPVAELRDTVQHNWPSNFSGNSRFYALGFDAYRLLPLLYNSHGISQAVPGVTGQLSLDPDGRVHRDLDWAEFDDGVPELLAPVALPPPPAPAGPATAAP